MRLRSYPLTHDHSDLGALVLRHHHRLVVQEGNLLTTSMPPTYLHHLNRNGSLILTTEAQSELHECPSKAVSDRLHWQTPLFFFANAWVVN